MRTLVGLAALLAAAPLGAQEALPWRASYFPYVIGNPATGPMLVTHVQLGRQADYTARVPYDGLAALDAATSAQGSRFLTARFRAPGLLAGWRFAADAGAVRESRFGYSLADRGLASGIPDSAGTFPGDPGQYDRVHRTRYYARAEVSRRIAGPLLVAAMVGVEHGVWTRMPGASYFRSEHPDGLRQTDAGGRLSVVLDLRDREFQTANGALLEAGVLFGGGGEWRELDVVESGNYGGWYAHLRGYLSPRPGTVVAARLAARALDRTAPLNARNTLPGWEAGVDALGGASAHRSFRPGAMAGRGLLLGSLELRHTLLDVGDYGAVTLVGFLDGGRVFEREAFSLTTAGWKVGSGGGLALRVLQSAMLTFNFAGGPDGFTFSMGTGWSF